MIEAREKRYLPDIDRRHRHQLTDHYNVFRQWLLTYDDSRNVHLLACNLTRRDLVLSCKAPNGNKRLRRVSYQNANIAVVGNQLHFRGSLECYTRSIFYFHPDTLARHHGQRLSILSTDKQRRLRMFSNIQMVSSMIPTLSHPHRHPGLCKSLADINLLHAVVCVDVQDAVIRR